MKIPKVLQPKIADPRFVAAMQEHLSIAIGGTCALFIMGLWNTEPVDVDLIAPSPDEARRFAYTLTGEDHGARKPHEDEGHESDRSYVRIHTDTAPEFNNIEILVPGATYDTLTFDEPGVRIQAADQLFKQLAIVARLRGGKYIERLRSIEETLRTA